ncbi:EAL domain-containing protein [Rhizobium sp. RU20A]|uniref:bifunctional diguanylate cyclase/phosphodiesterase n=1 Tax=Rhizobium sp. RU20A TaxID=1907412 RepID=UPI00122D2B9C|nr:EAL domain-containing protein [Rhizobium sp. RU20A]
MALVASCIVLFTGYVIDRQNAAVHQNELRLSVKSELDQLALSLKSEINRSIVAIKGVGNVFSVNPRVAEALFESYARKVLLQNPQFVRISVAPAGIVSMTFPRNQVIGANGKRLDRFATQRQSMERAQNNASALFDGPIRLPSGESAFNILVPIFTEIEGKSTFWGFMRASIDEAELYARAGLTADSNRLAIAIRDRSSHGTSVDPFFGEAAIFDDAPTTSRLVLPGGRWELAARPLQGWDQPSADAARIRMVTISALIFVIAIIMLFGAVLGDRQRSRATLRKRNDQLLTLSRRLDLALDASRIGIWEIDVRTGLGIVDDRMNALHGDHFSNQPLTVETWLTSLHPDDRLDGHKAMLRSLNEGLAYRAQYRVVLPSGAVRTIRGVGSIGETDGDRLILSGICWDVTDDVELNARLLEAKQRSDEQAAMLERTTRRLELALESYECGLWEAELDNDRTFWDQRMHQLHGKDYVDGLTTEEMWLSSLHPDDRAAALENVTHCIANDLPYSCQSRVVLPDGTVRHVRSVGKAHVGLDGRRRLIGLSFDVTSDVELTESLKAAKQIADARNIELAKAKDRIEHNALHDPLTGLGNRRMLDRELNRWVAERGGTLEGVAVLHIDLDRFKQINDTLGHAAGDAMLVHAASVIRLNTRAGDIVCRIGGDEFVIVVADVPADGYLTAMSERIIEQMRQPVDYNGFPCRFGVSIGIARARSPSTDSQQLLVNADIALYRAKESGRNRLEFFSESLQSAIITSKRVADEILDGIERGEFVAWYQPQFEASTHRLAGVEALIRWQHPREGLLTPDRFLKVAEEIDAMAKLDRIVLERAVLDSALWASRGLYMPKISVNVSARRLRDSALLETLREMNIAPGRIAFELVESIFLDESDDAVIANIEGVKSLGIDIELDDFGTGHTSIVSLLKLKPKRLKIDRQLVTPVLGAHNEQALLRSILDIGRSLGIETVAEGVETLVHAEMLSTLGCDLLQGYAFSRPLSPDALLDFALGHQRKVA